MISIEEVSNNDSQEFVEMLHNDDVLRLDLGFTDGVLPSADEFFHKTKEWCLKNNAISYSVILDDKTIIGMISLSHIDNESNTAGIGYWIGSPFRRLGYCTKAFGLVLVEAERRGLHKVYARIAKDNIASQKIWKTFSGYQSKTINEMDIYEIIFGDNNGMNTDNPTGCRLSQGRWSHKRQ